MREITSLARPSVDSASLWGRVQQIWRYFNRDPEMPQRFLGFFFYLALTFWIWQHNHHAGETFLLRRIPTDSRCPEKFPGFFFFKHKSKLQECLIWIQACGRSHDQVNPDRITKNEQTNFNVACISYEMVNRCLLLIWHLLGPSSTLPNSQLVWHKDALTSCATGQHRRLTLRKTPEYTTESSKWWRRSENRRRQRLNG